MAKRVLNLKRPVVYETLIARGNVYIIAIESNSAYSSLRGANNRRC